MNDSIESSEADAIEVTPRGVRWVPGQSGRQLASRAATRRHMEKVWDDICASLRSAWRFSSQR